MGASPLLAVCGGAFPALCGAAAPAGCGSGDGGRLHSRPGLQPARGPVPRAALRSRPRCLKCSLVPRPPSALGGCAGLRSPLCADILHRTALSCSRSAWGARPVRGGPQTPPAARGAAASCTARAHTVNSSLSSAQIGKD